MMLGRLGLRGAFVCRAVCSSSKFTLPMGSIRMKGSAHADQHVSEAIKGAIKDEVQRQLAELSTAVRLNPGLGLQLAGAIIRLVLNHETRDPALRSNNATQERHDEIATALQRLFEGEPIEDLDFRYPGQD